MWTAVFSHAKPDHNKNAVRMWPLTAGLHIRGEVVDPAPMEAGFGRRLPGEPVVWPSHHELIKSLPPGLRKATVEPLPKKKKKKKRQWPPAPRQ